MYFDKTAAPAVRDSFAQHGFTLIEMLIAVTVSLFIIGALIAVVLGSASTGRTREQVSDLQTNGRYALEQIRSDLLHAGYLGLTSLFAPDDPISAKPIVVTSVCDNSTVGQLSKRIWGANDSNPFSATCIPAARYSTGDVLLIRGLDPTPATVLSAGVVYYHSAYEKGEPFVGPTFTNTASFIGKALPHTNFRLEETVYYISPYTISAAETPKVPALYRTRLGVGPAMAPELVASGVENIQVRYGVFQVDDTIRYQSANEITTDDWDQVKSVQVWLLMRSAQPDPGYTNNTTYSMGSQNITVNDGFQRLLLSSVIDLRN